MEMQQITHSRAPFVLTRESECEVSVATHVAETKDAGLTVYCIKDYDTQLHGTDHGFDAGPRPVLVPALASDGSRPLWGGQHNSSSSLSAYSSPPYFPAKEEVTHMHMAVAWNVFDIIGAGVWPIDRM